MTRFRDADNLVVWFGDLEIRFQGTEQFPELRTDTLLLTTNHYLETKKRVWRVLDQLEFIFGYTNEQWAEIVLGSKRSEAQIAALKAERDELKSIAETTRAVALSERPQNVIDQPSDRTELEIRFYDGWPSCNIGVYNKPGLHAARNAEVWIERITGPSLPHSVNELLPHRLRTRNGSEKQCDINPDTEEVFEFATSSGDDPKEKGVEFQISALRLDPPKNTRADSEHIVLRLGEHLHVHIRVSCANADSQHAIFYASPRHPTIGLGIEVARIY